MEFYVMQPDADAPGGFGPLHIPSHRVYGVGMGGDNTGLMFDMYDAAEQCELDLEGIMGEFHPGQMELNMRYGPALDAADRAFICKEMTRELAARKGYWVTYMGRPMADLVGSGLHINLSLTPVHGGPNAFDDPAGRARAVDLGAAVPRRAHRPPRGDGGDVGPAGQQLQAVDPRDHRRLLGQLGSRQPDQHVPRPVRAWRGDADREPHAVWQRQPVPRRRGHAERRAARCRRRSRLRRAADRRRRRRAEHRSAHAARSRRSPRPRSRPTPCCARRWAPTW